MDAASCEVAHAFAPVVGDHDREEPLVGHEGPRVVTAGVRDGDIRVAVDLGEELETMCS
jgi:hypothetical protein